MRKMLMLSGLMLFSALQAAQAADMTGAEIKQLVSGNTIYLELAPGAPAGTGMATSISAPTAR